MNEELFNQYEYLVKITVKKMFSNPRAVANSKHLSYDDLLQYGRLGLWDACKSYQEKPIGTFRNYAIRNIKWAIGKYIAREELTTTYYKDKYYKYSENKKITLLSMSHKPFGEEDGNETTYYDIIGNDNINMGSESIESKVIHSIETDSILNNLKQKDRDLVTLKMKHDLSFQELAEHYGISRQAIQVKFKRIQKKLNSLGVVYN